MASSAKAGALKSKIKGTVKTEEKLIIHPHRSYRKLIDVSNGVLLFEFLILSVPLTVMVYFLYPFLTHINCVNANYLLAGIIPEDFIRIHEVPYLGQVVHILSIPGSYPTANFSFITAIVSLLILLILPRTKLLPKSISMWITFFLFINLVSAVFFMLVPHLFPYTVDVFSDLYMKTEVSMWLILSPLLAVSVLPLPSRLISKFFLILGILLLDIVLGIVRYAFFLYMLNKYSFLFMAVMFFSFGPLVDFLYAVATYSIYVSYVSKKIKKELKLWKWSY